MSNVRESQSEHFVLERTQKNFHCQMESFTIFHVFSTQDGNHANRFNGIVNQKKKIELLLHIFFNHKISNRTFCLNFEWEKWKYQINNHREQNDLLVILVHSHVGSQMIWYEKSVRFSFSSIFSAVRAVSLLLFLSFFCWWCGWAVYNFKLSSVGWENSKGSVL